MRRTVLIVAAIGLLAPWPLMAADDAPAQSGAFLSYCKTNSKGCSDKIADINFAMMITAPTDRKWCPGKETTDVGILTSKVVQWLASHPEAANKTTNDGIQSALMQLFPCKR